MEDSTTTYFADLGTCISIIKSVPCHICSQCGEVAYKIDVGERIEQIIDSMKNSLTEVAIVHFSHKAA